MNKTHIIVATILMVFSASTIGQTENSKSADTKITPTAPKLICDGFALPNNGIDGKVTMDKKTGKWYFAADKDMTDGKGIIIAGMKTELLPSSTLEKIILTIKSDTENKTNKLDIKLWGRITSYTNRYSTKEYFFNAETYIDKIYTSNYIFPSNFSKLVTAVNEKPEEIKAEPEEDKNGTDEKSIIPSEARKIFKSKREELADKETPRTKKDSIIPERIKKQYKLEKVEDLSKWKKGIGVEGDAIITDRVGFYKKSGEDNIFMLDALGRNVIGTEFKLLPCQTLQWTQRELAKNPGRLRYKVSGTITKYRGDYYLLLQRSIRAFNHGNFAY